MYRPGPSRYHSYHSAKQGIVGHARVAPAWRSNVASTSAPVLTRKPSSNPNGSKILLSKMPLDVPETDVEDLFRKTVGPLQDCYIVYNRKGQSRGIAVVHFVNPGDAAQAKFKYDGKFIDGHPIKIELISDDGVVEAKKAAASAAPKPPTSLLARISAPNSSTPPSRPAAAANNHNLPRQAAAVARLAATNSTHPQAGKAQIPHANIPSGPRRMRKGPKRLKKVVQPKTIHDLDAEMDNYRAAAPTKSSQAA
ncbi:hypothetical protein CYLTODRAFT_391955 [Cylindrobasidium torrendii FP15055 ss-10]|uniref:RRM domain-containing protein n=1 Tax=Cylindrobasidium torrendii FP15055 ss-10 TaxID=1314674 RepID=A0A0D7BLM4_9AGAR|nr:hypothetical protein CYLTODRAFT_391955 [Cylindrobasidium torrendii FP15055 ss-10]